MSSTHVELIKIKKLKGLNKHIF